MAKDVATLGYSSLLGRHLSQVLAMVEMLTRFEDRVESMPVPELD